MKLDTRILVTGGHGFLGSHVMRALATHGYRSASTFRSKQYDLVRAADVTRLLDELKPEVILHLAAVVGGIGSNLGSLVGGFLVGVITSYAAYTYGGEFQDVVALALLVGVLMLRPQGLLGRPAARRV